MPAIASIAITPALDGARVLYRHWMSERPPVEGWIREFNKDASLMRVSASQRATDAGMWHRTIEMRVDAVLEPAKAPKTREPRNIETPEVEP